MKKTGFITLAAAATVLISTIAVLARGDFEKPDYENTTVNPPDAVSRAGFEQRLDAQLPLDLEFKNEAGETVRLGDYFGEKPVVLNLVYFNCPMLCNVILNGLTDTLKEIPFIPGREYEVVTVSFNHLESHELAAAKKKSYIEAFENEDAASGWHFLTGSEENIKQLADTVGFTFAWDEKSEEYAHASGIMVATPKGRLSHYFYGIMYEPRDVRLSLVDASNGKIGSPVDQLLLFCYHYDSATGTFGPAVFRMIQFGGGLTIGLMVLFMVVSLRREFHQRRIKEATA